MRCQPTSSRGWTLVEVAIVLAIVAILTEPVVANLRTQLSRARLGAHTSQLRTDIALARSLATSEGQAATVSFHSNEAGACYLVHVGPRHACTCTPGGTASCADEAGQVRAVRHLPLSDGINLQASAERISFDPVHGTATPTATLRLQTAKAGEQRVVVSLTGRTRACAVGLPRSELVSC